MRPYFVLRTVSVADAWLLSAARSPARASPEYRNAAAAARSARIASTRAFVGGLLTELEIMVTSGCHGGAAWELASPRREDDRLPHDVTQRRGPYAAMKAALREGESASSLSCARGAATRSTKGAPDSGRWRQTPARSVPRATRSTRLDGEEVDREHALRLLSQARSPSKPAAATGGTEALLAQDLPDSRG